MLSALLLSTCFAAQGPSYTDLNRVFAKGEKSEYEVRASLTTERRVIGLETWMPEDLDIRYKFKYEVVEMKADGICDLKYVRPTMTITEGETYDSPPKETVEKVDLNFLLTMSPVNDLIGMKDLNPPKPEKPPVAKLRSVNPLAGVPQETLQAFVGQFAGEIYRLALFAGSMDASLDFAPKLPYDEVKVGDKWKRTVGYSPQKLAGKGGKLAVQRLDYTFEYVGMAETSGKPYHRVIANLELKTDLAEFIHQMFNVKPAETGLKEIPLQLKASVEFDLDPQTRKTIAARAQSEGGFSILITRFPDRPIQEERFKGRATLKLLSG